MLDEGPSETLGVDVWSCENRDLETTTTTVGTASDAVLVSVEDGAPALGITLGLLEGQLVDGIKLLEGTACGGRETRSLNPEPCLMLGHLLLRQIEVWSVVVMDTTLICEGECGEELGEALPDHVEEAVTVE